MVVPPRCCSGQDSSSALPGGSGYTLCCKHKKKRVRDYEKNEEATPTFLQDQLAAMSVMSVFFLLSSDQ